MLCDAYEPPRLLPDGTVTEIKPIPTNSRFACNEAMDAAKDQEPWFGIEQEYTVLNAKTKWPLGWPTCGYPGPQGPYYCSAGAGAAIGRDLIESHMKVRKNETFFIFIVSFIFTHKLAVFPLLI